MSADSDREPQQYDPPSVEQDVITFWRNNHIFEKSMEQRHDNEPFVFLEGPPTANGLPHPGHVLTRTIKDVVLRYRTMQGYYVARKAGWDTHGLPVEIEVEKSLGLEEKQEIEDYGIERFNEQCQESVFRYEEAWKQMTERVGFWLDMEHPYVTLKNDYIESVWWSLKQAWKRGLLTRGHRVTPYCPRCGTTLSSHEVAQGYKEVTDPSIYIKFKLKDRDAFLLAWTTTPWTLISNVALAVHPDELYVKIEYRGEEIILAEQRAIELFEDDEIRMLDAWKGEELEGMKYEPLYRYAEPDRPAWRVITADYVTMDDGTGVVHIAPAFGEEDYEAGKENDLPVVQLVEEDGTFPPAVQKWAGQFVKDADPDIIADLEERGLLLASHDVTHQYPFCWRCSSPLLYYAIESWFITMSRLREELMDNNEHIDWYPEHLKHGRFGGFIEEARDWSLSRKRYWGTPLPIWTCQECDHELCVGSVEELCEHAAEVPEEYNLHRPFVDELELSCPECNGAMQREPDVIDAWYDSGSAFFAQWHYPFENRETFNKNFPADFICEAIDQTRGWFYSLLAISTLTFDSHPYEQVVSLGLILDREGQKMSKKDRNYVSPDQIFDREGADAMRWYLISASAPWSPKRFYEEVVREALGKFLLTLWNVYSFYDTYASLDGFTYDEQSIEPAERSNLDRWVLSRLNTVTGQVNMHVEQYELHKAARLIEDYVVNDISNWYIRNSRKRFWLEEESPDKLAGYTTVYELLETLSRLVAPFVPFISEHIYRSLKQRFATGIEPESVHLCDYPSANATMVDEQLEAQMEQARTITEVARSLRARHDVKLRYPLATAVIVGDDLSTLAPLLENEINVKNVIFEDSLEPYLERVATPNFSTLGPKLKDHVDIVAEVIKNTSPDDLPGTTVAVNGDTYTIQEEDYDVEEQEREGYAIDTAGDVDIVLSLEQTDELLAEGFARELVRRVQEMRKDLDLDMEERIITSIDIDGSRIEGWTDYIKTETRSDELIMGSPNGDLVREWNIDGETITIGIGRR
jgi:isoleucyl-tRNA synthetase